MLTSLSLVFLVGLSLAAICEKIRLPRIVSMIAAGIMLGPYVLNLLDPQILGISSKLRQMALIIILIKAGLSLDLSDLKKIGRPAVLMSFVPASFEILGYVLFAPLFLGVSRIEAALMGAVLSAVSPAVVIPRMLRLMEEKRGIEKGIPQLIMAGASCDDMLVIVLFAAFSDMAQGGTVRLLDFVNSSLKVLIILSVSFLLVAMETWAKSWVAVSGWLAVVSMTCVLKAKSTACVIGQLSEKFGKLWLAAEVILFVLVGAAMDIRYTLSAGIAAVGMIGAALIFRAAGVALCLVGTPLNSRECIFCVIAYLPKATVQAAIGSVPLSMGLPCGSIVLSVAVLGILITSPLGALGIDLSDKRLLKQQQ